MNTDRPLVLFDASYVAHRARYSISGMSHNEMATSVIYGFLETIRSVCVGPRIGSNRVGICFDSRSSFRKDEFPDYKAKRHESRTPAEVAAIAVMHEQLDILRRKILPEVGFPCYRQVGCESDDVMAMIASQANPGTGEKIVMVTADGDLYQCITNGGVDWYDPSRDLFLNHDTFWARKGVWPSQWGQVKTIAGCSGDGVPGVGGVGEKTAIDYVLGMQIKSIARKQAIECEKGQKIIKRNARLVVLPHPKTKPVTVREPEYDIDAFDRWCRELGMRSYLTGSRRAAWESFFGGKTGTVARQVPRTRRVAAGAK